MGNYVFGNSSNVFYRDVTYSVHSSDGITVIIKTENDVC